MVKILMWTLGALLLVAAIAKMFTLSGPAPLTTPNLAEIVAACGPPDIVGQETVDGTVNQVLKYYRYGTTVRWNQAAGVFFESLEYHRLWTARETIEAMPCLARSGR